MPKLIDHKHPYQIKNLNSISEYLFLLKNLLRIISSSKIQQKIEGINLPIRWSLKYSSWVIDFGSDKQRDVEGIHLNNLRFYYDENTEIFNSIVSILKKLNNCNKLNEFGNTFKLFKNENRFLNFVMKENKFYLTGLYNRCQTKKRSGIFSNKNFKSIIIDNSEDFLNLSKNKINFIFVPEFYNLNFDYLIEYKNFINLIEKEEICFLLKSKENILYSLKDYMNLKDKPKKYEINKYYEAINQEIYFNKADLMQFLILHITLMFNNFVLKNLNNNKSNSIVLEDKYSNQIVKLVTDFNINKNKVEKVFKKPLLPVRF